MRTDLFKRIFVLYGALLLVAVLGIEVYVTSAVRESEIESLRDSLAIQARLMSREVPFGHPVPLDELCRRYKEMTGSRVTIIGTGGKVLGDSDHESFTMDNHGDRLEVQQADLSGTGMAIRTSDTLGSDLLYVAVKIVHDGSLQGFIRLSVPLRDVDATVNALRLRILTAVTVILLATGLFSIWQIGHLRRLTLQIRDFAAAVARGELSHRLFLSRKGEFDEIAHSLNSMSKNLQQSIAASHGERDRLSVILSSIPDALLISDANGVIQLASSASRAFFGPAPLKGRQFIEVIRDSEFIALLDQVRRSSTSVSSELTIDLPDERYFVVTLSPLSYQQGEVSGFLALFHDITQLKKLEQVRKDFVANISHEIRTPITAIQGFAETLLDGALNDKDNARSFIETIRDNSRRINSLVDDLMTISRIELGVIAVEKNDVAFEDVADTVLATFKDKASQKGLPLRKSVPPGAGIVRADRDRLVQIMTNLVDNAIKFTDKGSVTLGMTEENGRTVLFVEDTGIGVAEKHLPRLGERFYRVDAARSRSMGGTGLGLAIVKHLVKAHGWEMQIESTIGKGTTVRIITSQS